LRSRSLLHYRGKISKNLTTGESKNGDAVGLRFDYAAIGTVSNVASRLCDEAKPGQILISPRVLMAVKDAVTVEPIGEFELKGIRRPIAAYNVLAASAPTQ
jgi:class 3 adenylate cyclase